MRVALEPTPPGAFLALDKPADPNLSLMQRVRALPLAEALRLARSSDVQERIALERLHGKLAWEPLLRNPGLSIPEVLRIASAPTLPATLLDVVVQNPAWLANEQVRRMLLANRSLKGQNVTKVLRATPKKDLELMVKQGGVPHGVRDAARRMLGK